ncbi:MAG: hypothetical protein JNM06_19510 [Blastocatellia bacterium]|nr:hypothetical protein [Blastocatellia bacterium]
MKLIKLDSLNLTQTNKVNASLLYENWEIDEVIENLSEDEQELLIERISVLAETWELTLDAELELSLQTKYKESKTTFAYTDWLYDVAQEEIYQAYAIEKLNEQKNKASLVGSNNSVNDKTISFPTPNTQTATTIAATPTDLSADQTTNNNSLLDYEEQINQIIENLSEVEQDTLMEKTISLFEQWESTADTVLKLALKMQHQKSLPNIPYQDFLYELAQSQVYREYAIEQLESAKQSNSFGFIEPFNQIEKVHCDKLTNVDDVNIAGFNFNDKEATRDEVISIGETNHLINYLNQESVVTQDNDSPENYLQETNSSQGYQNEINKPLIVSNYDYHITKGYPNYFRKNPINYFYQQNSSCSRDNYSWKNSLPLTKAKKALLMHIHQGKVTSIHNPPSMPP